MPECGKFITVEGTEGVGKSTNIKLIREILEASGIDLVVTREPGGTPLAEELRGLLLAKRAEKVDSLAELLMVFAARAQHVNNVIKPALSEGKWVLSDRFTDATFAYQGFGRGLSLEAIGQLENMVQNEFRPDVTFLLDIDVETGLARAQARGDLDRFEEENINFFNRVRAGYQSRVAAEPSRFVVVNAGQPLGCVQDEIRKNITKILPELP